MKTARLILSILFSAGIMTAGYFFPVLGLAVPILLVIAAVSTLLKKRWFCNNLCPRAAILDNVPFSRKKPMPRFLYSDGVRSMLCAFLMICAVGQTSRLLHRPDELGAFFWMVCIITFAISLFLAVTFKPRAWCAVCPLGTLQDTLSPKRKNP